MIDRVLEEAARRHSIRPTDGLQIVGTAALARCAFDPSWPLLVLPDDAAVGSAGQDRDVPGDQVRVRGLQHPAPEVAPGDTPDSLAVFEPVVLPGRGGHGGSPLDVLAALYPSSHPVLGLVGAADSTVGALQSADLATGVHLLPALDPLANSGEPARSALDRRAPPGTGRLPVGSRAGPRQPPPIPARGGLRGLRRARARGNRRSRRGARGSPATDRAACSAWGGGGALRPRRRVPPHCREDRAPASARVC